MSVSIKRYAILTPFGQPSVVAGILALHHIEADVVMTESGAVVVREMAAPIYDEWDIRNITGPDELDDAELAPSDNAPAVAAILSRLSKYGVVLLDVDLGEDVGIEVGVSGMVRARRFLAGEAQEEISAGALLNVLDSLIEKLVLGYAKPSDHDAINSFEVTTEMIERLVHGARGVSGEESEPDDGALDSSHEADAGQEPLAQQEAAAGLSDDEGAGSGALLDDEDASSGSSAPAEGDARE